MTNQVSQNNKRIAKNSFLLYIRMFVIMIITLYTSRVILQSLGVTDYGIYNVVGGVVAMMGMVSGAMSAATARYLTYELGRSDYRQLERVFSICVQIYVSISILVLIVGETVGLWFLNTQLVIPEDRIVAANWVFQCSLITIILEMIIQPYQSLIIAHEKMSLYALSSITEAVAKLITAYVIVIIPCDKLALYGCLMMSSILLARSLYVVYCLRMYKESHFHFYIDKALYKEILSYSGWNLFGSASALVKMQGLNILLNIFFNPSVNAARGIAAQINGALIQFEQNFYTAVRPQITKYYAQSDLKNMFTLIFRSSKMSFYLVLLLAVPITIEAPFIINLWLGQLPEYVIPFTRLIIAISALESISHSLMTACHATGRVALYQSLVGTALLLNIPISYIVLKMGYPPISVFIVSLFITVLCLFLRVYVVKHVIQSFPSYKYIRDVIGICLLTAFLSYIVPTIIHMISPFSLMSAVFVGLTSIVSVLVFSYYIGLTQSEKVFARSFVNQLINRLWRK